MSDKRSGREKRARKGPEEQAPEHEPTDVKSYTPGTQKQLLVRIANAVRDMLLEEPAVTEYVKELGRKAGSLHGKVACEIFLDDRFVWDRYDVIEDNVRRQVWPERQKIWALLKKLEGGQPIEDADVAKSEDSLKGSGVVLQVLSRVASKERVARLMEAGRLALDTLSGIAEEEGWEGSQAVERGSELREKAARAKGKGGVRQRSG